MSVCVASVMCATTLCCDWTLRGRSFARGDHVTTCACAPPDQVTGFCSVGLVTLGSWLAACVNVDQLTILGFLITDVQILHV